MIDKNHNGRKYGMATLLAEEILKIKITSTIEPKTQEENIISESGIEREDLSAKELIIAFNKAKKRL